jgi:hypothetical protein
MDTYVYIGAEDKPPKRLSYGDFDRAPAGTEEPVYIFPSLLGGGDHAGTGLENASNHRVFWKRFRRVAGVHNLYGGYGTFAIAIRKDVAESKEAIRETLADLEEYPLISEEDHSMLEMEETRKSWEDWGRSGFIHDLTKALNLEEDSLEEILKQLFPEDTDPISTLFNECAEDANEYWRDDNGSMYIDIEKIVPYAGDRILLHTTPQHDLPLLIGRKWSSSKYHIEFEAKLKAV